MTTVLGVNSSNNSDSGIIARVFQSILRFMQDNDAGVYFIMTSNDVSQLPPELTRAGRLDSQWFFSFPNKKDREEIFKIHFRKYDRVLSKDTMAAAVDVTENFTGAEIAEAVKNVMRKAFLRSQKTSNKKVAINSTDILLGVREVTPVFESNKERINALRNWVKDRARFTDGSEDKEVQKDVPFDPLDGGLSL